MKVTRICLRCNKPFLSRNIGHRICPQCHHIETVLKGNNVYQKQIFKVIWSPERYTE